MAPDERRARTTGSLMRRSVSEAVEYRNEVTSPGGANRTDGWGTLRLVTSML